MKHTLSKSWVPPMVVATIVCCLMMSALVLVTDAEAQQQQSSEAEIEARVRAELEARMAQLNQRLLEQMREIEVLRNAEVEGAREQMAAREQRVRQILEQQYAVASSVQAEAAEEMRARAVELQRRLEEVAAQEALVTRRGGTYRIRGGCDAFGEQVLDAADDLELTDDQVAAVRDAQRAARRERIGRDADMEVGELDLEALYEVEDPDLGAIRAKLEELAMLNVDHQMAGLALRQEVRNVLTPAQIESFEEMGADNNVRIVVSGVSTSWNVARMGC